MGTIFHHTLFAHVSISQNSSHIPWITSSFRRQRYHLIPRLPPVFDKKKLFFCPESSTAANTPVSRDQNHHSMYPRSAGKQDQVTYPVSHFLLGPATTSVATPVIPRTRKRIKNSISRAVTGISTTESSALPIHVNLLSNHNFSLLLNPDSSLSSTPSNPYTPAQSIPLFHCSSIDPNLSVPNSFSPGTTFYCSRFITP